MVYIGYLLIFGVGILFGIVIGMEVERKRYSQGERKEKQVSKPENTGIHGTIASKEDLTIKIIKKKESQPFEKDVLDKLDAEVRDQTPIQG